MELNGNTTLSLTFEELWSPMHVNNAEEIFSVQYERAGYPGVEATGGHGLQNTFGNYYGDCTSTGLKYVNSEKCPTVKANMMWEKGDQRYEGTFMTTIYNYKGTWGTEGYYAYYNAADLSTMPIADKYFPYYTTVAEAEAWLAEHKDQFVQGECVNAPNAIIMSDPAIVFTFNADGSVAGHTSKAYNENLIGNTMHFTPVVKKWDDPESKQLGLSAGVRTNDYRDVVVLHASDTYLDAAEAYLMAGNKGKALEKVNAVRARAGLTTPITFESYVPTYTVPSGFVEQEIDLILDERARETYAELHRWMDLRRTKQLVRYNVAFNPYLPSAASVKGYRPIPQAEINSNTALTNESQNEGY
ncbi:MAG: RagB/SusD family nutrient uptake outer membrane protein [Paludibacteraceae bacterium]